MNYVNPMNSVVARDIETARRERHERFTMAMDAEKAAQEEAEMLVLETEKIAKQAALNAQNAKQNAIQAQQNAVLASHKAQQLRIMTTASKFEAMQRKAQIVSAKEETDRLFNDSILFGERALQRKRDQQRSGTDSLNDAFNKFSI